MHTFTGGIECVPSVLLACRLVWGGGGDRPLAYLHQADAPLEQRIREWDGGARILQRDDGDHL